MTLVVKEDCRQNVVMTSPPCHEYTAVPPANVNDLYITYLNTFIIEIIAFRFFKSKSNLTISFKI